MSGFRRFIIGLSTIFLVISLCFAGLLGAIIGFGMGWVWSYQFLVGVYIGSVPAMAILGMLLGAVLGVISSALPLALLFLLEEIHGNSKLTAEYLGMIAGGGPAKGPSLDGL